MEVGLAITTPTKLQFSRCSWLLTTQISKRNILGGHIRIWRQRTHNHMWIASSENYRGFGPQPVKKVKRSDGKPPGEENDVVSKARQLLSSKKKESMGSKSVAEAPNVLAGSKVNKQLDADADPTFDQRLDVIRRSALEKKELEEKKKYQPIDYDAPVSKSEKISLGLGAKIGIGVAIAAFALVFSIGDLFLSGSGEKQIEQKELTAEDDAKFQAQLQRFEETLKSNPEDLQALEAHGKRIYDSIHSDGYVGAAVAHAELGEYTEAAALLEKLTQKSTKDPEAFRLLGDVRYACEDYEGSAVAYRNAIMDSSTGSLEVLSGLTNALVAAKKPNEAVQELLAAKDRLRMETKILDSNTQVDESSNKSKDFEQVDPVQIDMLLGKAYSDWGHIGDAVAVYDSLIASRPNDFRGYLAKGILLKANGKVGDAERMFIQAKYFAPPKAKALVDRYSGQ